MKKNFPRALQKGDEVRIIAPSRSLAIISKDLREIANQRFRELNLNLSFGKNVEKTDNFASSSIQARVEDFHQAFSNKKVKAILTVIGGFNSNQLLKYLDWDLIRKNPKILCGFSDITVLSNAIFTKTRLVGYSGPHYSTFGQKRHFDYTLEYFRKCLFSKAPFKILPSPKWSDDLWFKDQDKRRLIKNPGWQIINQGEAQGTILGGNVGSFRLLSGTEYFPNLKDSILFLEDDEETLAHHFDRELQSLIHYSGFSGVKAIVIGRFQKVSRINGPILKEIIKSKQELQEIPIIANVDFGHTDPKITFPIGGEAKIIAKNNKAEIEILKH